MNETRDVFPICNLSVNDVLYFPSIVPGCSLDVSIFPSVQVWCGSLWRGEGGRVENKKDENYPEGEREREEELRLLESSQKDSLLLELSGTAGGHGNIWKKDK